MNEKARRVTGGLDGTRLVSLILDLSNKRDDGYWRHRASQTIDPEIEGGVQTLN